MINRPLVGYILTAARRDKLMITLLLMIVLVASLSIFMGSASVIEEDQFSMVLGSGSLRLLGVTGIVLFCSFYMRRVFENKEAEFFLSRPLSRTTFLLSHATAFIILALLVAVAVELPMFFIARPSMDGLIAWCLSLMVEYAIVAVATLFFSMVLSSAAGTALATFGLYVLSRLIGVLLGIAAQPADGWIFLILNKVMQVISVVIPRLDLMGQTSWLVYGVDGSANLGVQEGASGYAQSMITHLGISGFVLMQGVFFVALLLMASLYDFTRRRF